MEALTQRNEMILQLLDPQFSDNVRTVLSRTAAMGADFILLEGLRNPLKQAVYWKQSRNQNEIVQQIELLQSKHAYFLAYCLHVVGDHKGSHITNALPGASWHQYGLAVDCAWIINSKICWDNESQMDGINGYEVLSNEALNLNICSGHHWTDLKDSGHLQAEFSASPLDQYKWNEIDKMMEERYSKLLITK